MAVMRSSSAFRRSLRSLSETSRRCIREKLPARETFEAAQDFGLHVAGGLQRLLETAPHLGLHVAHGFVKPFETPA
jgi:hypothetical protein